MSNCVTPPSANPNNGRTGGGGGPFVVVPQPFPQWTLELLQDAEKFGGLDTVKSALSDFLTKVDNANLRYQEAVDGIELAYSRTIDEAAFELREKLLLSR